MRNSKLRITVFLNIEAHTKRLDTPVWGDSKKHYTAILFVPSCILPQLKAIVKAEIVIRCQTWSISNIGKVHARKTK